MLYLSSRFRNASCATVCFDNANITLDIDIPQSNPSASNTLYMNKHIGMVMINTLINEPRNAIFSTPIPIIVQKAKEEIPKNRKYTDQ